MASERAASEGDEPLLAGRYRLDEVIGRGGMGEVRRAYDLKLRRRVAIKLLTSAPDDEQHAGRIQRLLREARAVAALNHPNVVAVYDVSEDERAPFIVMELVEGGSVATRLRAGDHPSTEQALDWLAQAAAALACAHRAGIVHRDVKPDNLLVDREGRLKIADFGIVKALEEAVPDGPTLSSRNGDLTGVGKMVGTPRYMAPEQLRGEQVDGRTDQFAWGIVAFELLARKHPYEATSAVTTPQMVANGVFRPPRVAERNPDVPKAVDDLLARCLAAEPVDRATTMSEVETALVAARSNAPSGLTRTETAVESVVEKRADGPATAKSRSIDGTKLAAIAMLVGLAAFGISRIGRAPAETPPSATVTQASPPPPATSVVIAPTPSAEPSASAPRSVLPVRPRPKPLALPSARSAEPSPPAPPDEIPSIRK